MADFSGVTNPKRVTERRIGEAEGTAAAKAAKAAPKNPIGFTKPFTKEEREAQMQKLGAALMKRTQPGL